MTRCTQGPNPPGDGFGVYCARARFSRGSWRTAGDVICYWYCWCIVYYVCPVSRAFLFLFPLVLLFLASRFPFPVSRFSFPASCLHVRVRCLPLDSRVNTSYRIEMPCMSASPFGMQCDTPNRVESGESAWCFSCLHSFSYIRS